MGASVVAYFIGAVSLVPTLAVLLLALNLEFALVMTLGTLQMAILTPFLYRYSRLSWLHIERRMTTRLEG